MRNNIVFLKIKKNLKNEYGKTTLWKFQIMPTLKYAQKLQRIYNCDKFIVSLSSLLLDYGKLKKMDNHTITGSKEAKKLLSSYKLNKEDISAISYCVRTHSGDYKKKRITLEAICCAEANLMAVFDNIDFLYNLAIRNQRTPTESYQLVISKLRRNFNLLSDTAKSLVLKKLNNFKKMNV